jgi:ankyrin repeat protein
MNALVSAAESGDIDCMIALLDSGFDINSRDETGRNACYLAIVNHHFDALKLLVERGAAVTVQGDVNIAYTFLLHTLVHRIGPAIEKMAILLLDVGAPIDMPYAYEMNWLVKKTKSVAVLDRLLARGLDVAALRDPFSQRTLCHMITDNFESTPNFHSLLIAAVDRAKVDINAKDYQGLTALHGAASSHDLDTIRLLVELGADVDVVDSSNYSPLHIIFGHCSLFNCDTAELLLSLGANVHIAEASSLSTVCHEAAKQADYNAVCAFIAAGSNLDQPDANGHTPRSILWQTRVRLIFDSDIEAACRRIARKRLDLVRGRAYIICVALQSFNLPALQMCEILMHMSTFSSLIKFHQWWAIVTTVKHYFS